ncbi:MAG: hypothetical protein KG003_02615 [Bacteroidetes bacterium]|nr:hypothetical protein [Bacteroidota bacterium]
MNRPISIIIILLLLTSCLGNKSTFDQNGKIQKLGTPIKLEYFKHVRGKVFKFSDTATFVITDQQQLEAVMDEIKNADNPELWRGVGWNRIRIYYTDTILNIYTNNKKIGTSSSGRFYDLGKENFITRQINEK